jgi:hypothetical protein
MARPLALENVIAFGDLSETQGNDVHPDWVIGCLPPQYAEIARQIAELRQHALRYEGAAGVLWRTGPPLVAAVRELFSALGFEAELPGPGASYDLRVELDGMRRLLVEVVGGTERLDRRSPVIARILRALQEEAGEGDRVVLAANLFSAMPVESRPDELVTADALRLVQGLGANIVPTVTLFGIWKSSLGDRPLAQRMLAHLHSMDGGVLR